MIRTTAIAILVLVCTANMGTPTTASSDAVLDVGQVWTIKNSPAPDTRLVIGRVEGETVHVSIEFVPVPPDYPSPEGKISIAHMPFERSAITASVVQLVQRDGRPNRNFEEGYQRWKAASGGRFDIPVSETIAAVVGTAQIGERKTR